MKKIILLNFLFSIFFLFHVIVIGTSQRSPSTRVYKKTLEDMKFPLIFKMCASYQFDINQKFRTFGYESPREYFRGKSMYTGKHGLYGWRGHSKNLTTMGSVKGKVLSSPGPSPSPCPNIPPSPPHQKRKKEGFGPRADLTLKSQHYHRLWLLHHRLWLPPHNS